MRIELQPDFCRLGSSLSTVDFNGDGHEDLVIGNPFYLPTDNQTGVVTVLVSKDTYKGKSNPTHPQPHSIRDPIK